MRRKIAITPKFLLQNVRSLKVYLTYIVDDFVENFEFPAIVFYSLIDFMSFLWRRNNFG